mmetsp:Transcript_11031/g.17699  ORF Transcript_11031/g.17699 Transcript_11031/m.17699 type:complete len:206 (-) Transcript_11031:201-818(-)
MTAVVVLVAAAIRLDAVFVQLLMVVLAALPPVPGHGPSFAEGPVQRVDEFLNQWRDFSRLLSLSLAHVGGSNGRLNLSIRMMSFDQTKALETGQFQFVLGFDFGLVTQQGSLVTVLCRPFDRHGDAATDGRIVSYANGVFVDTNLRMKRDGPLQRSRWAGQGRSSRARLGHRIGDHVTGDPASGTNILDSINGTSHVVAVVAPTT